MGSLGFSELIFIFALALLIFGPRKLPQIGRTIGRSLAEFRKASTDLKRTINAEMIEEEIRQSDPRRILAEKPEAESVAEAPRRGAVAADAAVSGADASGAEPTVRADRAAGTVSRGSVSAAEGGGGPDPVGADDATAGAARPAADDAATDIEQPVESKAL